MKWKYDSNQNFYYSRVSGVDFIAVPYKRKGRMRLSVRRVTYLRYQLLGTVPSYLAAATKLVKKFMSTY